MGEVEQPTRSIEEIASSPIKRIVSSSIHDTQEHGNYHAPVRLLNDWPVQYPLLADNGFTHVGSASVQVPTETTLEPTSIFP